MSAKPVYVFTTWRVKEGALQTVLSLLKQVIQKSREEKGNLLYHVHQSISDPNTLVLHEYYTGEEAVNEHRSSAHFQNIVIGEIIPLLEQRDVTLTQLLPE